MIAARCTVLGSSPRSHWIAHRLKLSPPTLSSPLAKLTQRVVFADQLGIDQLLRYPKALLQRQQVLVVDISGSWFSHLAKRRQAFGYHHYLLCDGLWTDFGMQHGFAFCVGGSARAQQRAARFFHRLAPYRGLWLPLATAEDASFAAVLLNSAYYLLLQVSQAPLHNRDITLPLEMVCQALHTQLTLSEHVQLACQHYLHYRRTTTISTGFPLFVRELHHALQRLPNQAQLRQLWQQHPLPATYQDYLQRLFEQPQPH